MLQEVIHSTRNIIQYKIQRHCLFSSGTIFLFCLTKCIYVIVIAESETMPLLFSTFSFDITGDESTFGSITVGGKYLNGDIARKLL